MYVAFCLILFCLLSGSAFEFLGSGRLWCPVSPTHSHTKNSRLVVLNATTGAFEQPDFGVWGFRA